MMDESRLRGEALYWCFVDFKKAFDTIPRKKLWERMEKLEVPEEYKSSVARIYEKVRCVVRMGGQQSNFFSSDIKIKQGCPLSPTLFGLCIDELEEMVQYFVANKGINCPTIAQATILLLMYANDVLLVSRTYEDTNKLMEVLEDLCELSGLWVFTHTKPKPCLAKREVEGRRSNPRSLTRASPSKQSTPSST